MNVFKRKSIYLAVAASLGAVGVSGGAAAVTLSQTGTGEVLIYPYYTARNGTDTYISVTNTTASAKAVKVRFLEGKNSREVLDFNLYLSANDMWTGAVVATATGARLVTTDKSCSAVTDAGGATFVNYAYAGTNTAQAAGVVPNTTTGNVGDWESQSLDRSREGYFEIIEMGTILAGTTLETSVTHVDGVPDDCDYANNFTALLAAAQLVEPTGGLAGNATLINVNAGTDFSYDPVALSAFANAQIWDVSGSIHPDMTDVVPNTSTVFKNGAPVVSTWARAAGSAADPVTAVLMHDRLVNDYVLDAATLSSTDWVVTMPTKRHYIGVDDDANVITNAPISPFTTEFTTGGACEPVTLVYFDREEGTPPPGSDASVSPLPPGVSGDALCWESTVLTFNGSSTTSSDVLGSSNFVSKTLETGYNNGWMSMAFDDVGHTMTDGTYVYDGLPAIGFMVQDFNNGTLTVNGQNVLSVYGGSFIHKYRTNITGGAITAPTGE